MKRLALFFLLLGVGAAAAQSLYPSMIGGCGVGGLVGGGCAVSGGGGKFVPPGHLTNDAGSSILTDDGGTNELTAD